MKPGKSYLNFFFPSKQACIKLISLAALMSSSHKLRVCFGTLACLGQTSIQAASHPVGISIMMMNGPS